MNTIVDQPNRSKTTAQHAAIMADSPTNEASCQKTGKAPYPFPFIAVSLFFLLSCSVTPQYDLVIQNATVLQVETGERLPHQHIYIKDGKIVEIGDQTRFTSRNVIDAQEKLVTPGFIDTHIHPTDVFGDYADAPAFIPKDSVDVYRQRLSNEYLPYGVTTALMMGHPESWLDDILSWRDGDSLYTDFLTTGGALISREARPTYIGHLTVDGVDAARQKVTAYHNQGIRHIKVYHRLREPEFSTVIHTADSLNMRVFGHIGDFDPTRLHIQQTLASGLKHYEHIATFPYSIIRTENEWKTFDMHFESLFGKPNTIEKVLMMFLESFRYIDTHKNEEAQALIHQLANSEASFSTTLGFIHQYIKPSHHFPSAESELTEAQRERSQENFAVMMRYLKTMADAGIPIRIATDAKFGGKVLITELHILSEYGFSTADIFWIATQNGARALGLDHEIGAIRQGMTADMLIWDASPFDNPEHFFSQKTVIKHGVMLGE